MARQAIPASALLGTVRASLRRLFRSDLTLPSPRSTRFDVAPLLFEGSAKCALGDWGTAGRSSMGRRMASTGSNVAVSIVFWDGCGGVAPCRAAAAIALAVTIEGGALAKSTSGSGSKRQNSASAPQRMVTRNPRDNQRANCGPVRSFDWRTSSNSASTIVRSRAAHSLCFI